MPAVPLPPGLDEKLAELSAEVRRLRLIRGISWTALVLFTLPVAAIAVDSTIGSGLPRYARILTFAGWAALGALVAWLLVWRRMREDVPPAQLAAAIEEKYPSLSERLRTLVELSEHADPGNGSKALIAVLARETEKRTQKLNFYRVAPTGVSFRAAAVALVCGAVAVALIFFVRWYAPPVEVAFTVAVSSGHPIVKRGEPVTLTAFLKKAKPTAVLPDTAVLVFREPGGTLEKKLPMAGDDKAAFSVTRPKVETDFEYAVECGDQRTDWHTVTAVDPVELTAGTTTTATAPPYVTANATEKREGLVEMKLLQFGIVVYELKFNRAATNAKVEWRPADAKADQLPEPIPLGLAADRLSATYIHHATALGTGTLKFVLTGDKGWNSEYPIAIDVAADAPPRFNPEKDTGLPRGLREVRPDRPLKLTLDVSDDVAVESVVVEFAQLQNGKAEELKTEAIKLAGPGSPRVEAIYFFTLDGKVKDGETIRLRLKATDNRLVPAAGLLPQTTTYPADEWLILKANSSAVPLVEQEIAGQKARVEARLGAAIQKIDDAEKLVEKVRAATEGKPRLEPDQTVRLDQAREKAREAAAELDAVAAEAGAAAALRTGAREAASKHLRPADDELRKANNSIDTEKRDESVANAADHLKQARVALDELRQRNADAARDRVSAAKLHELAEEQERLAEETAKAAPDRAADLAAKQKELRDRLDRLLSEDDKLKKAAEAANKQDAAALADELRRLKQQQEELDAAARAVAERPRKESADEIRKKQEELAKKASELKKKTDAAARAAQADPLDQKPFEEARDKVTGDKPLDALTEQEKAARELDRLAEKLAEQANRRRDAKEAASQIARWQDDLRRRVVAADRQHPNGLPAAEQQKLQAEQKAIQKATDRLKLPPSEALEQLRQQASARAGQATEAVGNADSDAALKKSADTLEELAKKIPSNAERLKAAKDELEKLRREQDVMAREATEAVKAAGGKNPDDKTTRDELAKKLKAVAEKQDELAKKVEALDTPGQEQRRGRTADSARQASEDLRGGLPQDIPTSQDDAKRKMDRLRDALNGNTPADDKANELARMQQQLSDELTKMKEPKPEDLQRLQRRQKEINRELAKLAAPEAAGEKNDARDAGQAAEAALQKPEPDVDELRKKSKAAADAAKKLADKLQGESDEEKLDRLARNRAEQARKAAEGDRTDNASRDAREQLDRDRNDLNNTRAGDAQAAKKKAADALERLRRTPDPEKQKELQKQAAEAMKDLADQVRKNGDRRPGPDRAAQPNPDPADANDPENRLATEEQARAALDLAQQQRELRDELSKAAEQANRQQPKATEGDPLGELAKQQANIAKQAEEAAKKADEAAKPCCQGGAAAAGNAAGKLTAGDAKAAEKAGQEAAAQLRQASDKATDAGTKKETADLAQKQEDLNSKIAEAGKDAGAAAARQQRRQQELAREAQELADKLDRAAERQPGGQPMGQQALKDAAEQARQAHERMEKAGQESGKPDKAADARKQANEKLQQAADAAGKGAGQPMPKPMNSEPGQGPGTGAGQAAQQAGDKMAQAQGDLGKGPGGKSNAERAMKDAAEKLQDAAKKAEGQGQGEGKPEPGNGGGGDKSGGNTGEPNKAPTEKIPSAVAENLGKSWGNLPGDVKSKIIQELSAKYGEDYAKAIKLYFEQLAERK